MIVRFAINNILLLYSFIIIIFFSTPTLKADIYQAYNYYTYGDYDSALHIYQELLNVDDKLVDAYYGVINCYLAKEEYSQAIKFKEQLLSADTSFYTFHKLAYVCALNNRNRDVNTLYNRAISTFKNNNSNIDPASHNSIIRSIAFGYLTNKNLRLAKKWYSKGLALFSYDSLFFEQSIDLVDQKQKARYNQNINLKTGYSSFYGNHNFKYGLFYSTNGSIILNKHTELSVGFTNYKVTPMHNKFYYGLKVTDTLLNPPNDGSLYDSLEVSPAIWLYYPYDIKQFSNNKDKSYIYFDSINISNITGNSLYFLVQNYNKILKNTQLSIGGHYGMSNVTNTKQSIAFFFKHLTNISKFSLGIFYSGLISDKNTVAQVTPETSWHTKHFSLKILMSIQNAIYSESEEILPIWQYSPSINMGLFLKPISIKGTFSYGRNTFAILNNGRLFNSNSTPTILNGSITTELHPFPFGLILYHIFSYSQFKQYHQLTQTGGIYLSW